LEEGKWELDIESFQQRVIGVLEEEPVKFWTDALGVSRSVVSHKWIKGVSMPKPDLLWKIAEVKKLSANWLLFNYGPKQMSEVDSASSADQDANAAEKFMKLFPVDVQNYIVQAVKLVPEGTQADNMPFLINTMNILSDYLLREKSAATPLTKGKKGDYDFKMRVDGKGNLTHCNQKMLSTFGIDPDKDYGFPYKYPIDPKDMERFNAALSELSPEEPGINARIRMEMPTGISEWQEWEFRATFNKAGQQTELTGIGNIVPSHRIRSKKR